jgi:hypothetical protein
LLVTEDFVPTPEPSQRSGLLFAGLCALSGAFVPALAKLTTDRADPLFVAAVTTLFAGLAAALVLGIRRKLVHWNAAETEAGQTHSLQGSSITRCPLRIPSVDPSFSNGVCPRPRSKLGGEAAGELRWLVEAAQTACASSGTSERWIAIAAATIST